MKKKRNIMTNIRSLMLYMQILVEIRMVCKEE